jgi:integrase
MTPRRLLPEELRFSSVNVNSQPSPSIKDYSASLNLETYLEAISKEDFLSLSDEPVDYGKLFHSSRRRGLEQVLDGLHRQEIPGKGHVGEYLKDQYRRNLKVNTFRNSSKAIISFLEFAKERGRHHLEEIIREDLEAWVEQEQDRGMKAATVEMRLGLLKAFVRFLIERDILRPEVLSRRLFIKVPDALPRAMDPDDVKRLLSVIDCVRDRAMITVLLRTGMRIGELLNTLLREVHLEEQKIEIYEAEKTRVGRVV